MTTIKLILENNEEFELKRINCRINSAITKEEIYDIEFLNSIRNIRELFNKVSEQKFKVIKEDLEEGIEELLLDDNEFIPIGIYRDITTEREDCHMNFQFKDSMNE